MKIYFPLPFGQSCDPLWIIFCVSMLKFLSRLDGYFHLPFLGLPSGIMHTSLTMHTSLSVFSACVLFQLSNVGSQ